MEISRDLRMQKKEEDDLNAIVTYFKKRQMENPYFYYDVRVNSEGRMVNFLWINGKSRLWYDYFGDVIIFDSSHGLCRYKKCVKLTPILGINHHTEWIFLGWALLLDQSEESFIWLFNSWYRAMHEKPPSMVIINPDPIAVSAIKTVFPNTSYKLSLWHMKGEFKNHIAKLQGKANLKEKFKRCVSDSIVIDRFERDWEKLVRENDLGNLEWVKELYQTRDLWVPAYNRKAFAAGLCSSRSKDAIFSFLDTLFLYDRTSLRRFVIMCEKEMMNSYRREKTSDFESRKMPELILGSSLEIHAGLVYTPIMFSMFQEELIESTCLIMKRVEKNGPCRKYQVSNPYFQEESFLVTLNVSTYLGACECRFYEYMGIPCSHILVVLHRKNVLEIPEHFIMSRWTKEANKGARFSLKVDPEDPNAPALRKAAIHRCVNYCRCIAEQSGEVYSAYASYFDRIIRDICSTQIADGDDSDYIIDNDYSEDSQPIGEEDIEYLVSIAERSADAYQIIVKGLEDLVRDVSNNAVFTLREDVHYTEDTETSEDDESVNEEFRGVQVGEPYHMQMDYDGDSVEGEIGERNEELEYDEAHEGGDPVEGEFGEWDEDLGSDEAHEGGDPVEGEFGEWDEFSDSDEAANELNQMEVDETSESGSEVSGELSELSLENECECRVCCENGFDVCTCLSIGF